MTEFEKNIRASNRQLTSRGLAADRLHALQGGTYDGVVITGMGGSGLAGGLLAGLARELGITVPVIMWRDYGLPYHPGLRRPLYLLVSFSGTTEETLSGLKKLLKKRKVHRGVAVVATGGALLKLAVKENIPRVAFAAGTLTPRQSTGRIFYGLIEILLAAGLLRRRIPEFTHLRPALLKQRGEALARMLKGRVVTIYSDEAGRALGYLWKQKLNETAKVLAFSHVLPEMNHGELMSFEKPTAPIAALFLPPLYSSLRLRKRMALTQLLMRQCGAKVLRVPPYGKSTLEKIWRSAMLADWTSYALARLRKVSPAEILLVDALKARMGR
jgi:glucose/mannose-6-phosphate isomerase